MHNDFDPGPPPQWSALFRAVPDYSAFKQYFWYDWGAVFYRGRLDGSAKVLCIGSDPGATERIAGRTLVGDAGQRVQGFLAKLGITRSYLCLNAFAYPLIPSQASHGAAILGDPAHLQWRNQLYDLAKGPKIQVVIGFGEQAQHALALWPGKGSIRIFKLPHPTSHDPVVLLNSWRAAIKELRSIVTPDIDGDNTVPNYGKTFGEDDYKAIPRFDLPFGVPKFLGDDSWVRKKPGHKGSVSRPNPDDRHTLIWKAPVT